jgi:hypothetical protein
MGLMNDTPTTAAVTKRFTVERHHPLTPGHGDRFTFRTRWGAWLWCQIDACFSGQHYSLHDAQVGRTVEHWVR